MNPVAQINLLWSFRFIHTETSFHGPLLQPLLYLSSDISAGEISTLDDYFKASWLLKPLASYSLYSQHVPLPLTLLNSQRKQTPEEELEPLTSWLPNSCLTKAVTCIWLRAYEEEESQWNRCPAALPSLPSGHFSVDFAFFLQSLFFNWHLNVLKSLPSIKSPPWSHIFLLPFPLDWLPDHQISWKIVSVPSPPPLLLFTFLAKAVPKVTSYLLQVLNVLFIASVL